MTYAMEVRWIQCGQDGQFHWCSLEKLTDMSHWSLNRLGVYIIWNEGNTDRAVRVGQGELRKRISAHRNDQEILSHRHRGTLRVTWAPVESQYLDGVEKYLAEKLDPRVGKQFPDAEPIMVNLPFE